MMDRGELVPDDIMGEIIKETLNDDSCINGFILDGFPRTLNQAKILDKIFEECDCGRPFLITLEAEDDLIVKRLSQRRACTACGNIVNLNYLTDHDQCPACGTYNSFAKRKDDEVDVIVNRLKVFHRTTQPVLDYYSSNTVINKFNATLSVEEITNQIMAKIN
jgi:adenylate kinase